MSTLGERIKEIRKVNQLNQVEFANVVGVSQGTLSELEQDKYKPSLDTIIAIQLMFKVDLDWLVLGAHNQSLTDKHLKSGLMKRKMIWFPHIENLDLMIRMRFSSLFG